MSASTNTPDAAAATATTPAPAPAPAPGGGWTKHNSPDGRPFWSKNGQSVWDKPDELKTPAERAVGAETPWKEYETGGRKYWVNKDSNETTWNCPREIVDILARFNNSNSNSTPGPVPSPVPAHVAPAAGGSASPMTMTPQSGALVGAGMSSLPPRPPGLPQIPLAAAAAAAAAAASSSATASTIVPVVTFDTPEQAQAAFKGMLKQMQVDETWTWEMVMKEAITDPLYKALKTLQERKDAFEEYLREHRELERAETEKSLNKSRKDFHKALEKVGGGVLYEGGVKSWWSFERATRAMSEKFADAWQGPRNDQERKILFDEFVTSLRQKEETRKRELRGKNMDKLTRILESLELDLAGPVRWQDVRATLFRTPEWHRDVELQRMEPIDMLTVVEDEVRRAEKDLAEQRQRVAEEKRRRARKAREDYVALLAELVAADQIASGTTWKSIYPLIASDPRYLNLVGTPGSSPLDLFWDVVDDLDVRAEQDEREVEFVARDLGVDVDESMTEETFVDRLRGDARMEKMDMRAIKSTFDKLQYRAIRAAKEQRRRAEKKLRIMVDDLRYAYKKLDPPVELDSSYENVLPRIKDEPEFLALKDNESACRTAFEKFIKRQKEKRAEREAEEAERAERERVRAERRAREREHDIEYEIERERDRERRLGGSSGGGGGAGAGRSRRDSASGAGELPYDAASSGGQGAGTEDRKRRTSVVEHDLEGGDSTGRESKIRKLSSSSTTKTKGEDGEVEEGEI